jgi:hypothetical protein
MHCQSEPIGQVSRDLIPQRLLHESEMQKGEKKKASESTVHNAILRSPTFRADALPYKTNRNESSSAKIKQYADNSMGRVPLMRLAALGGFTKKS